MKMLRGKPCKSGCPYCRSAFGIHRKLKELFGFERFRTYGGEPLQERAVEAAETPKFLKSVQQPVVDLLPAGGQPVKRVYLIVKQLPGLFRVIQRVVSLISLELVVILDLGAVREDGAKFHSPSVRDFRARA